MHSHLHGHPALLHAVRRLERLNPDKFELYFVRKVSTKIEAKNQKVDSLSRAEDVGLSVRLIKDRRMGFSFTTSLESASIDRAVDSASEVAQSMPEDENVDLHSFGSSVYPAVDSHDAQGLTSPVDWKIRLALDLEAQCRKHDRRVTGVRSASVGETSQEVHMVDSNGEHIAHQSTLYTASITCKAEDGGDSQVGHDFAFSNYLDNLDVVQVGRRAADWATELLGAGAPPTMKCPAVLRNSVVAELVEFLSSSFSAEEMAKGRSMLAGKEGTRQFSEQVTLIDDGLYPGGYGTSPFDGEGTPSAKTVLVDGGFVSGALFDGYYARKNGKDPTGSAVRGIKAPPVIGISNLYMQAGRKKPETLLDGISRGVLITDLLGVHTANAVTGNFSLGASGILIEGGKLTRPVRGFAVAGNILEVFRRMTDISNDLRFFGAVGAPSVRISEISVGGA
jgi:PmbA protein